MAHRIIAFCLGLLTAGLAPGWGSALAQAYVADYRQVVTLHAFGADEPGDPIGAVVFDKAGNLYGTESGYNYAKPGAVFELTPPPAGAPYKGWKETVLYNFAGGSDGSTPSGSLIIDAKGNLFGTTSIGGAGCPSTFSYGCGIIFELSPPKIGSTQWSETVLYRFTNNTDGAFPSGRLAIDSSGNIYGTTVQGGRTSCNLGYGCGTIFELSPPISDQTAWGFKVIYAATTDSIVGGVVFDKAGNLYGVTHSTAFKLSPSADGQTAWAETQIASFGDYYAAAGAVVGPDGNLYGFHQGNGPKGVGDIYELTAPSKGIRWPLQFLFRFNGSDGFYPLASPIFDNGGNIYGATYQGGHYGKGLVFEYSTDGTLHLLYKFQPNGRAGVNPESTLTLDTAGNVFGASTAGGPNGKGAVWEVLAR